MDDNSIIVIGANQTALVFAAFAADGGFGVQVFEKKKKQDVAYDWTDDMTEDTFPSIGMVLPPREVYTRKRSWTFVPPEKEKCIYAELPEKELDLAVYRRPFNNWLYDRAVERGVQICYEKSVCSLIVRDGRTAGVILESGEEIYAPMVVDCSGVNSAVRSSLPDSFHIPQEVNTDDTFSVRRAFFNRPEGTVRPEFTNKAYLKHMNEKGISWCILSHDEKAADVLIGRVGGLSDENYNRALIDLKKDNDIIGDTVIKGGEKLTIPVRRPISRMVSDGYALLGDSAYMTIPMLGSGMASGMRAGKTLSEVLIRPVGEAFSKENLYRYQYRFMRDTGARHAAVDLMKSWLLSSRDGDVDFLLCRGVVNKKVLKQASAGEMVSLTLPELISAGLRGAKKPKLLLGLCSLLIKMKIQYHMAKSLPESFDEAKLSAWEKKYNGVN